MEKSNQAAGQLWRLAQATAFLRAVNNNTEPEFDPDGTIKPTAADVAAVMREHPDLVALANGRRNQ